MLFRGWRSLGLGSARFFQQTFDAGKIVFNYGLWAIYRQQGWDQTGPIAPSGNSYPQLQSTLKN